MPPTSQVPVTNESRRMKSETSDTLTSGYSTKHQTPTQSREDLTEISLDELKKALVPCQNSEIDKNSDISDQSSTDLSHIPVVKANELDVYVKWYNKLIKMKEQYRNKERGSFPPFPPPPLPSSMIAASNATHSINTFEQGWNGKLNNNNILHDISQSNNHRFRPSDFKSFPPPHVFLEMIQTLKPHQYVDLTYALAGAVLLAIGVRVPDNFPPLPPKIEPFSKFASEQTDGSIASSQSSSDGEYSDDSDNTKLLKKRKKDENKLRRNARLLKIYRKMEWELKKRDSTDSKEKEKKMAIDQEINYKSRTLKKFIQRQRRNPLPQAFKSSPPVCFLNPLLPQPTAFPVNSHQIVPPIPPAFIFGTSSTGYVLTPVPLMYTMPVPAIPTEYLEKKDNEEEVEKLEQKAPTAKNIISE